MKRWLLVLVALGTWVGGKPVLAQVIQVSNPDNLAAAEILQEIAADGDYTVLSRDTVLPEDYRTSGDLVVWSADVRLEGSIDGRVAVVDGVLFVRPGASIRGPIAIIGGEYYPSGLASAPDPQLLPLTVETRSRLAADTLTVRLIGPPERSAIRLSGFGGFHLPTYDRVDGVSLRLGTEGGWPATDPDRGLSAWGVYHSARGELDGGAAGEIRLAGDYWAVAQGTSATRTNDAWKKGDLANGLSALFFRSDSRDYYHSDALSLSLERRLKEPLIEGESFIGPRVTLLYSEDRSLRNHSPWSVFSRDEPWRPNRAISEGTLASLSVGSELGWMGTGASFVGDVWIEWAPPAWSDFEFAQWVADGTWTMAALWGHSIAVHGRAAAPLGSGTVPIQRWNALGGSGTLSTFEFDDFRGDHLAFVESVYSAPLPWAKLPLVGVPTLEFRHSVGMAWSGEDSPPWEQNLGIRLKILLLHATLYMDPASATFEPEISFGTSF